MKKIKLGLQTVVLLLVTFLVGCTDTINMDNVDSDYSRDLNFAGPIANIHTTAAALISEYDTENVIREYSDGLLYRSYKKEVVLVRPDILTFSDQKVDLTGVPIIAGTTKTIVLTNNIKLNDDNTMRYDEMEFYNGQLNYNFVFPIKTTGTINISFPELFDDKGISVVINRPISTSITAGIGLSKYKIKFAHSTTPVNSSYIKAIVTISYTNTNTVNTFADAHIALTGIEPEVVFGYFGQHVVNNLMQSITMDLYDTNQLGRSVEFGDIYLKVYTDNYIGAPFSIAVKNVKVTNTDSQQSKTMFFKESDTFYLDSAKWTTQLTPVTDSIILNKANSNINDITNMYPDNVTCDIITSINPNNTKNTNFISRNDKLITNIEMQFPLWFRTTNYNRKDTIDFNINDIVSGGEEQADRIQFMKLYIQNTNGIPIDLKLQAYLTDDKYNKVDSLYTEKQLFCKACSTNSKMRLEQPTKNEFITILDGTKIKKLMKANVKYILLETTGITPSTKTPPEFVKIFKENYMDNSVQLEIVSNGVSQ